jgi:hypothetical protein
MYLGLDLGVGVIALILMVKATNHGFVFSSFPIWKHHTLGYFSFFQKEIHE